MEVPITRVFFIVFPFWEGSRFRQAWFSGTGKTGTRHLTGGGRSAPLAPGFTGLPGIAAFGLTPLSSEFLHHFYAAAVTIQSLNAALLHFPLDTSPRRLDHGAASFFGRAATLRYRPRSSAAMTA